jgi:uncharacterized Zn finger protein
VPDSQLLDIFAKCPGCGMVNRLVTTPLPESHVVTCSQCGSPMGEIGKLRQMANAGETNQSATETSPCSPRP